ncbi:MAG: ABC transporter permease [Spirochaetaceae bacterium]|nr:MAG: ABC transporter permease [Spirochaetaceae bacterium]
MRQFLTVLRYTFIRNWRDPSTFTEQILLPLGLILVLGGALGGAMEGRDIGPTAVAYVIEGDSPAARSVRAFFEREDVERYLAATNAGSLENAFELLRTQEVFTAVHVPAEFGTDPESLDLRLIERTGNELRTGIVRAVLNNYALAANVTMALQAELAPSTAGEPAFEYGPMSAVFEAQEISRAGRAPGAFDFYSISMLMLTVMYVAGYAVDAMREDILDPIGRRVRTTAVRPWAHLSGKLTANAAGGVVQAAVIVAVTLVVFGANWGERPLLLAAIVASVTLFAVAFGALVLAIVRDGQKAQSIVNAIVLGSMIVSGGAIQFGAVGEGFRAIQRLLPHYQGQTALLAMVYDRAPGAIPEAFVYFLGGAALALALTVFLSRRSA